MDVANTPRKSRHNTKVVENTKNLRQLLTINRLKHSKRRKDKLKFKAAVRDLKATGNVTNIARNLCVEPSLVLSTCRTRSKNDPSSSQKRLSQQELNLMENVYCDNRISMNVPHKKHAGKRFMTVTLEEAYQLYKKRATEQGLPVRVESTFRKHRPAKVKLMSQIPDMGCACTTCVNAGLLHKAVITASGIEGIRSKFSENLTRTLCADDILNCKMECVDRRCGSCGTQELYKEIFQENNDMESVKSWASTAVSYKVWEHVKGTRTDKKGDIIPTDKPMKLRKETTVDKLLMKWLRALYEIAPHVFAHKWQSEQYESMKTKLLPGDILMVCDFGTNWGAHVAEEIQNVNWTRDQVTIHNSVCYFRCPGCNIVDKDEIAIFSDDLNHDWAAVDQFTTEMLQHLQQNRGVAVDRLIRFSDNCPTQYRSQKVFWTVSARRIPFISNTFGAHHGKKEADGFGGRNSQMVERAIKGGEDSITNAATMTAFCQLKSDRIKSGKEPLPSNMQFKPRWKLTRQDINDVEDFCRRNDISHAHNDGTRRLAMSVSAAHRMFNLERLQTEHDVPLSLSSFSQNIPPDIIQGLQIDVVHTLPATPLPNREPAVLQRDPCPRQSEHNTRTYLCINQINRNDEPDTTSIKGTLHIHCVRNTGQEGIVEVRRHTCLCDACLKGNGECTTTNVEPFARCDIRGAATRARNPVPLHSFENDVWGGNCAVDLQKKFKPPKNLRKQDVDFTGERRKKVPLELSSSSGEDSSDNEQLPASCDFHSSSDSTEPPGPPPTNKTKRLRKKKHSNVRRKLIAADKDAPANFEELQLDVEPLLNRTTAARQPQEDLRQADALQGPDVMVAVLAASDKSNQQEDVRQKEADPDDHLRPLDWEDLQSEKRAANDVTSDDYSTPLKEQIQKMFFQEEASATETTTLSPQAERHNLETDFAPTPTPDRPGQVEPAECASVVQATATTSESYYADSPFVCKIKEVEQTDRVLRLKRYKQFFFRIWWCEHRFNVDLHTSSPKCWKRVWCVWKLALNAYFCKTAVTSTAVWRRMPSGKTLSKSCVSYPTLKKGTQICCLSNHQSCITSSSRRPRHFPIKTLFLASCSRMRYSRWCFVWTEFNNFRAEPIKNITSASDSDHDIPLSELKRKMLHSEKRSDDPQVLYVQKDFIVNT